MPVTITEFDSLPSGAGVEKITLTNKKGFSLSILNYGAIISNIIFDDTDVALGYDDITGYINGKGYIGSTVGRYANRIKEGTFTLNGRRYFVGKNENGVCHLHGGLKGFNQKIWDYKILRKGNNPAVKFSVFSHDGDMGYPGNLTLNVTFSVTADNAFYIEYEATTDKDTVVNFTNHTYFNLNGYDGPAITNNTLEIPADYINELDENLVPTDNLMAVKGTPLDFTTAKPLGQDMEADHPQMVKGGGYDRNYIFNDPSGMHKGAVAYSPLTGITMTCFTDQPAVQLYSAGGLNDINGKGGKPMGKYQGFCLETQHYPDSPNHPEFPTTILKAGETFTSITAYQFSK